MISIEQSAYFVPASRFHVIADIERFKINIVQAKVFSKIYGLNEIPYAKDMSLTNLIEKPIQKLLQDETIQKSDIKYIIHAHTAKVISSFGRSIIQEVKANLGLHQAIAFGTSLNNCASTLNAFEIADVLLSNHDQRAKAIIVTGEMAFTPTVQVIPNTSITGDAAAAALVSRKKMNDNLLSLKMLTAGQYSKGIWLTPAESKDFEKNYVSLLSKVILEAIFQANLKLDDIKMIIPHNVNLISWSNVAKHINYPIKNIYLDNVKKYAHCFGADILINFTDIKDKELLSKGDYYVMATVGLGATFAAAVFQY